MNGMMSSRPDRIQCCGIYCCDGLAYCHAVETGQIYVSYLNESVSNLISMLGAMRS